jgi:hypothetical protein
MMITINKIALHLAKHWVGEDKNKTSKPLTKLDVRFGFGEFGTLPDRLTSLESVLLRLGGGTGERFHEQICASSSV